MQLAKGSCTAINSFSFCSHRSFVSSATANSLCRRLFSSSASINCPRNCAKSPSCFDNRFQINKVKGMGLYRIENPDVFLFLCQFPKLQPPVAKVILPFPAHCNPAGNVEVCRRRVIFNAEFVVFFHVKCGMTVWSWRWMWMVIVWRWRRKRFLDGLIFYQT
jgi:hypothetical protein